MEAMEAKINPLTTEKKNSGIPLEREFDFRKNVVKDIKWVSMIMNLMFLSSLII